MWQQPRKQEEQGQGAHVLSRRTTVSFGKLEAKDDVKEGIVACLGECKDDREELQICSTGAA